MGTYPSKARAKDARMSAALVSPSSQLRCRECGRWTGVEPSPRLQAAGRLLPGADSLLWLPPPQVVQQLCQVSPPYRSLSSADWLTCLDSPRSLQGRGTPERV